MKLYALFNPAIEILTISGLNFEEVGQDDPLNQGMLNLNLGPWFRLRIKYSYCLEKTQNNLGFSHGMSVGVGANLFLLED